MDDESSPARVRRRLLGEVRRLFDTTRDDRTRPLGDSHHCGCALGEALAIRWQDIDFERRTLAIVGSLHRENDRGMVRGPAKTERNRVVKLRPATIEALRRHKAQQAEMRPAAGADWKNGDDLAFTTATGGALDLRSVQELFDRACERAGVERRKLKETRHTLVTLGLIQGVPVKVISEAQGHASVAITYDIHVIGELQDESLSHLDRLFSS